MKRLLIVDDNPIIIKTLTSFLKMDFFCESYLDPKAALEYLNHHKVDMVLLDIYMPELDGITFLRILNERQIHVPVIFLTSDDTPELEIKGLQFGAVDFIRKPVFRESLILRIQNHLRVYSGIESLEQSLLKSNEQVKQLENLVVLGVEAATTLRDLETGSHIHRIALTSSMIARVLKQNGETEIGDSFIDDIEKAAPFHDIGKLAIPDQILKKPGKLTKEEFEAVKTHTTKGREAIRLLIQNEDTPFLKMAEDIALYHHERWNGEGYPQGIQKHDIPLSARIVAIADVYDALVSERVYKPAMAHIEAIEIIQSESGSHFDPTIVAAFMTIADEINAIYSTWQESPKSSSSNG